MKKLKKGLSLVLVLVMVFGLATNAFAWDTTYADNDQITYKEAVEAMSGMGIIDGKLDNMFDPAGDYTREQAAKVITYMLLGPEAAKVLEQPTNTGFSDVDAERWSSGYIAYAAAQDIIVGWGGEFHPEDTLTRAQWLKMLLVALGYDPIENGLEDNLNWETNALTLALKVKLIDSKEATATFNRELAVQYGFNALQTDVVDKDGKPIPDGDGNKTLSEDIFDLHEGLGTDEFGRTYKTWTGNDVVYATNYAEPVLTYSNKEVAVTYAEKSISDKADITKVIVNGVPKDEAPAPDETIGGRSTEVEIYKNDDNTYTAIVMELRVKKLAKNDLEDKAFADFEKGDVVTYFEGKDGVISNVTKLEGVEGKITAVAGDYLRLDNGDPIYKATKIAGDEIGLNNEVTAYIDSYGNLIYLVTKEAAAQEERQPDGYAYVLFEQAAVTVSKPGDLFDETVDGSAAAKAQIIDLTAGAAGDKAVVVDVAVAKNDSGWYYADKDGKVPAEGAEKVEENGKNAVNAYKAYYILDDGTYVFETATSYNNVQVQPEKPYYNLPKAYATKDTVLDVVYVDDASNPTKIVSVESYTGYTTFPEIKGNAVILTKDNDITRIILMVTATEEEPDTYETYAISLGYKEQTADKKYHYTIYVVATGETVDFATDSQPVDLAEGNVVTFTIDKETNELVALTADASAKTTGTVEKLQETYMVVNGTTYKFAETCYYYGEELAEGATVELYGASNDAIDFVYVTKAAE